MPDFITGGIATDEDFFFRTDFIEIAWETLRKESILLTASRRSGKTSVMHAMMENPPHGMRVVFINVEDFSSPAEFVTALMSAFYANHRHTFVKKLAAGWDLLTDLFGRVELGYDEFRVNLREKTKGTDFRILGDQFLERIERSGTNVLFLIDELPDMIHHLKDRDRESTVTFLHWLRRIINRKKSVARWLFAGSSNLESTLDQMGELKVINALDKMKLPMFTEQEAAGFIKTMLGQRHVQFQDQIIHDMLSLIGEPSPFFLQVFTQEIYRFWRTQHAPDYLVSPTDVQFVFNETLMGERVRDKFQYFRHRLKIYYPAHEQAIACEILDKLSVSPNGFNLSGLLAIFNSAAAKSNINMTDPKGELFRLLLNLENDFYVRRKDGNIYDFENLLLKKWWAYYYGMDA